MPQVVRASTPWAVQTEAPERRTLPPEMVEAAALRLRWIAVCCATLTALLILVERQLQPEMAGVLQQPGMRLVWLFVVLASLGITAVQKYKLLAPMTILHLGVVFEVAVAAAISFSETAIQLPVDQPVLGTSMLAVWIGIVGLIIPNKPLIKLATALVSASMWPLAYSINVHLHGFAPLPANRLLMWIHLPFVMAFVSAALARRMYRMESAAQKARDLGSYELVALIGKGGMGEVWRARHRMLARDAAIKVVRADLMLTQPGYASEITRKRFAQEAQAIASLQSPHTVYLFDFGVAEDGSFYYVMELLDGISLQMLVEKFGPQPPARVIHMLRQVCASLEEAHRSGLVHRDIKPNNIFACLVGLEYDFMKVLDFGLVKNLARREETLHLTASGVTAGTPAYMAPEIAMGEDSIDGRVDIYGLGCVAYYLLTGSPVFDEKTATATAMAHVQKKPTPPSLRSELPIPAELEEIVLRCLAKRPEERPRSAQELSRQLQSLNGAGEWTREKAYAWWQTYLPAGCAYRAVRQPRTPAELARAVTEEGAARLAL